MSLQLSHWSRNEKIYTSHKLQKMIGNIFILFTAMAAATRPSSCSPVQISETKCISQLIDKFDPLDCGDLQILEYYDGGGENPENFCCAKKIIGVKYPMWVWKICVQSNFTTTPTTTTLSPMPTPKPTPKPTPAPTLAPTPASTTATTNTSPTTATTNTSPTTATTKTFPTTATTKTFPTTITLSTTTLRISSAFPPFTESSMAFSMSSAASQSDATLTSTLEDSSELSVIDTSVLDSPSLSTAKVDIVYLYVACSAAFCIFLASIVLVLLARRKKRRQRSLEDGVLEQNDSKQNGTKQTSSKIFNVEDDAKKDSRLYGQTSFATRSSSLPELDEKIGADSGAVQQEPKTSAQNVSVPSSPFKSRVEAMYGETSLQRKANAQNGVAMYAETSLTSPSPSSPSRVEAMYGETSLQRKANVQNGVAMYAETSLTSPSPSSPSRVVAMYGETSLQRNFDAQVVVPVYAETSLTK